MQAQERFNTPLAGRGRMRTLRELTQVKEAWHAQSAQLHVTPPVNQSTVTEQERAIAESQLQADGSGTYDSDQARQTANDANAAVPAPESPAEGSNAVEEPGNARQHEQAVAAAVKSARNAPRHEDRRKERSIPIRFVGLSMHIIAHC